MHSSLIAWILRAIPFGTIIMYGALGETVTEKSGNLNLGVPGIMYLGGFAGFASAWAYENTAANPSGAVSVVIALTCAILASMAGGLIYAFLTISLRANQNVTGLALTIFGTGVGQFIGEYMRVSENGYISVSNMLKGYFQNSPFPKGLQDIPVVGGVLFGNSFFFYLAVACAVALYWYLNKTRSGLYLRSVGESPATADAAGINVTKYKLIAFVTSASLAGAAGALFGLNYSSVSAAQFDFNTSILVLVYVVLGGLGNIWGSIVATVVLYVLPEALRQFSDYRMLVYAIVLILVMLATNSPFLSVRLQRLKALVRREKTNPGKEGEAA